MAALDLDAELPERFARFRAALAKACQASGRDLRAVRLIAVSKRKPAAAVAAAFSLGQRDFGENYAQELRDKHAELGAAGSLGPRAAELRWHFIGPLQRNKVHLVLGRACLIHSVDDADLIAAIRARLERTAAKAPQDILIQVNVAGETQKSGCSPAALPKLLDAVAASAGRLRCRGLMCMPPQADDPELSRPYFRKLRELAADAAKTNRPHVELGELSMGMSHDFAVAIAEGATLVRVGTALFGERSVS